MTWRQLFFRELLANTFLGSIPVVATYYLRGINLLDSFFSALIPAPFVALYYLFLAIPYIFAVAIDRFVWIKTDKGRELVTFWRSTTCEVGTAFHGVARALSGACLLVPVLWFFCERKNYNWVLGAEFFGFGVYLFFVSFALVILRCFLEGEIPSPKSKLTLAKPSFDTFSTPQNPETKKP